MSHLKWAIFFLKALSKRKKQKEITTCITKLKEYLSDKRPEDNNSRTALECKISVETVKFENVKQDSQVIRILQNLLKKDKVAKEGKETLNILTNVVSKIKLHSEDNITKEKLPEEPYGYITKKIKKMEILFNTILCNIKNEKLKLMLSLRTNHGSLGNFFSLLEPILS